RFVRFSGRRHPRELGKEDVERFLTDLAVNGQVAASTQNQALNAILFLYREVLDIQLEGIDAVRAKQPKKEPIVLSVEETGRLLAAVQGTSGLVCQLLYGCGLRLSEGIRLRIKDADLETGLIWVRSGKGGKDRSLTLPSRCRDQLEAQIAYAKTLYENDRRNQIAGVHLPNAFDRKSPEAGESWPWFWLIPSSQLSIDPRTGVERRHHVHDNSIGKALAVAAKRAGLNKRVTAHTLRHSFATHLVLRGVDIRSIQQLLGHADVRTTEIYTELALKMRGGITSPLDEL
ncbi:MAG: integron integrase, partial [Verrucomicrobiota bacterium]